MQKSRATNYRKPAFGFTLVELMVSITILTVIIIILTNIFNTTTKAWTSTEGGNERRRNARILTDFIASELRGALLPAETVLVGDKATKQANLQFVINPPSLAKNSIPISSDYQNPNTIFWQAPLATERSLGDIAEIGYFVKWVETGKPGERLPQLRRFFINPTVYDSEKTTFSSNNDFLIYSDKGKDKWLTNELIEKVAGASSDLEYKKKGYPGLFAENVCGFWVRFYGFSGKEVMTTATSTILAKGFDSRIGYSYIRKKGANKEDPEQYTENRYLPLQINISIAQFDARTAIKLAPVWKKVQAIANAPTSRDATMFMAAFQEAALADPQLRVLLPGLRTYATDVVLDAGR